MAKRFRILVRIEDASPLVLRKEENGWSGSLSVVLVGISQGFEPVSYTWKVYEDTVEEQSFVGKRVKVKLSIGSWERLRYEHIFRVTASDDLGNSADATYTVHVSPPDGELVPLYGDPSSKLGAKSTVHLDGLTRETLAYRTVLVKAETEGFVGRMSYAWSAEPGGLDEVVGSDGAIVWMQLNGDPDAVDSYEGSKVGVKIIDDIGQSLSLERFVEAKVQKTHPRLELRQK